MADLCQAKSPQGSANSPERIPADNGNRRISSRGEHPLDTRPFVLLITFDDGEVGNCYSSYAPPLKRMTKRAAYHKYRDVHDTPSFTAWNVVTTVVVVYEKILLRKYMVCLKNNWIS